MRASGPEPSASAPLRRVRLAVLGLVAATALQSGLAAQVPGGDPVRTQYGLLSGVEGPGSVSYKGVPYAAPPQGEMRWRSPVPPLPWDGVRKADAFGPPCMQAPLRGMTALSAISREDCLYLNIWTPKGAPKPAKLPVMLWIHGGGFINGAASSPTYSGEQIAARGVILVSINYRLGPFGFLAHPELTAQSAHRSSGNFGLEDQLAALRWVSDNISAFGGDPANVTIFGQSAGGASVLALLTSPKAQGLFARAIIQSGAVGGSFAAGSRELAEQHGVAFAAGQPIDALRRFDTQALIDRYANTIPGGARLGPVIDGYLIEQSPMDALSDPQRSPVALLVGSNAREGLGVIPDDALPAAIAKAFGDNSQKARQDYGLTGGGTGLVDPLLGSPAQQFSTDSTFRCGNVEAAGRNARSGAPTWQYQFEQFVPGKEAQGAAHSFEVPYVFGNLSSTGFSAADYDGDDRRLSAMMLAYWTNFAAKGDPNGPGLPAWPRYTPGQKRYLRLSSDYPAAAKADSDLRGTLCPLFQHHPNQE